MEFFDIAMNMPVRVELGQGHRNKKRGTGVIGKSNVELICALAMAYENRKTDFVIEHCGRSIKTIDLTKAYRRAGLEHVKSRAHILTNTPAALGSYRPVSGSKMLRSLSELPAS